MENEGSLGDVESSDSVIKGLLSNLVVGSNPNFMKADASD